MVTSIGTNAFPAGMSGASTPLSSRPEILSEGKPVEKPAVPEKQPVVMEEASKEEVRPQVDPEELAAAVAELTESVRNLQRSLLFSIHENSGRTVITVVDKGTDEVIRQIPSEEFLALADYFKSGGGLLGKVEA